MRHQQTLALVPVILLLISIAPHCSGQQVDRSRSNEVIDFIRNWNERKSVYVKAEFDKIFRDSLETLAKGKPAAWYERRTTIWEMLPEQLKPELPIAANGEIFLSSLFLENAESFSKQVPDAEGRGRLVTSKLYLVLSLAQQNAQKMDQPRIEPSHLFVAIASAWTGLWPICPQASIQIR